MKKKPLNRKQFAKLTPKDKVTIIQGAPEILNAVKLLCALNDEIKCKSHIRLTYDIGNITKEGKQRKFELTLLEILI